MNETNKQIDAMFQDNSFIYFYLNEDADRIMLERQDNHADSIIFNELNTITTTLVSLDVDFSIDMDGTIILEY